MTLWDRYLDLLALHDGLLSILVWAGTLWVIWWMFVVFVFVVREIAVGLSPRDSARRQKRNKVDELAAQGYDARQIHEMLQRGD